MLDIINDNNTELQQSSVGDQPTKDYWKKAPLLSLVPHF